MNEQNLIRPSSSEARENGKKGGLASGEARKKNKILKEAVCNLANTTMTKEEAEKLKIKYTEGMTYNDAIAVTIVGLAIKGNMRAISKYMEIMGEGKTLELKERMIEEKEW